VESVTKVGVTLLKKGGFKNEKDGFYTCPKRFLLRSILH
jgi:hypothetical protein